MMLLTEEAEDNEEEVLLLVRLLERDREETELREEQWHASQ